MTDILLANLEEIEDAYLMFRWTLTAVGGGMILIGLLMFFYKPKDEARQSEFSARVTAMISFGLIGIGTIVYAWTWFGS